MTLFWLNDGQMSLLLVKIISDDQKNRRTAKLVGHDRSRLVIFSHHLWLGDEIDCGL